MDKVPISSLPLKKQKLLLNSRLSPPCFISIDGHKYDKEKNVVFYNVQIGIKDGHFVDVKNLSIRYSAFEKLNKLVKPILESCCKTNPFPPKKFIGNKNEDFVCHREELLQKFLDISMETPDIIKLNEFACFFKIQAK